VFWAPGATRRHGSERRLAPEGKPASPTPLHRAPRRFGKKTQQGLVEVYNKEESEESALLFPGKKGHGGRSTWFFDWGMMTMLFRLLLLERGETQPVTFSKTRSITRRPTIRPCRRRSKGSGRDPERQDAIAPDSDPAVGLARILNPSASVGAVDPARCTGVTAHSVPKIGILLGLFECIRNAGDEKPWTPPSHELGLMAKASDNGTWPQSFRMRWGTVSQIPGILKSRRAFTKKTTAAGLALGKHTARTGGVTGDTVGDNFPRAAKPSASSSAISSFSSRTKDRSRRRRRR